MEHVNRKLACKTKKITKTNIKSKRVEIVYSIVSFGTFQITNKNEIVFERLQKVLQLKFMPIECASLKLVETYCSSRIAGQQSRQRYGEQITNFANVSTFFRQ